MLINNDQLLVFLVLGRMCLHKENKKSEPYLSALDDIRLERCPNLSRGAFLVKIETTKDRMDEENFIPEVVNILGLGPNKTMYEVLLSLEASLEQPFDL